MERRERSVRIGKLGFHQLTSPGTTDPARIPFLSGNLKKISICFRRSLGNHRILTQIFVLQLIPNANDLENTIFLGRGIDDVDGALPRGEPLGTAVDGAYPRLPVIINPHPITWTTPSYFTTPRKAAKWHHPTVGSEWRRRVHHTIVTRQDHHNNPTKDEATTCQTTHAGNPLNSRSPTMHRSRRGGTMDFSLR